MMASREEAGPSAGFTLIEVLVAFGILALVVGSAMVSISYSSRLFGRADEVRRAEVLAESLIAEKFTRAPGQAEHESGTTAGLRWTVTRAVRSEDPAGGTRVIDFNLELATQKGRMIDRYSTVYVEQGP
jgi:type II secretion system protein I